MSRTNLKDDSSGTDDDLSSPGKEALVVRSVQAGNKESFRILVMRYKDLVYAMIMRQVADHAAAEEISQDVFVKAFLNIGKFRLESKFSTWLTRIALNETSSYFSSKKFKQQKLSESFDAVKHDIGDGESRESMEEEARHNLLLKTFRAGLAGLKPRFRDVLVLCGLEGKTYEEAAAILEIPVGTVRSRLNKARHLIKQSVKSFALEEI